MKLQSATALILLALLFTSSLIKSDTIKTPPTDALPLPSPSGSLGCDKKCALKCSKGGWRKMCLKLCKVCCGKCDGCVPSGPNANNTECPCCRDMKEPQG